MVYELLLFLHLGGVLALATGVGTSLACKSMAVRVGSPSAVLALLRTASVSVHKVAMPGSFVLLGAGIGLVLASHGAYEFHEPWILGAIALWIASAWVGVRMHAPRSRVARELAQELVDRGEVVTGRLRSAIRDGRPASVLDTVLLVGMVVLMVFKPGQ